ncbi:hypothetical protein BC828DRAFT_378116 [Blastocladiella britannica]|nr:hypothetical protein BC828DRAFT_378116 [Blastocladiella britannica]
MQSKFTSKGKSGSQHHATATATHAHDHHGGHHVHGTAGPQERGAAAILHNSPYPAAALSNITVAANPASSSSEVHFVDGSDGRARTGSSNLVANGEMEVEREHELENYARILVRELESKNAQVEALQQQLSDTRGQSPSDAPASLTESVQRTALLDVAKKTRRMTLALEREKATAARYARRVAELEEALTLANDATTASSTGPGSVAASLQTELKAARDRQAAATRKLEEERSTVSALRTEVAKLHRALTAEIGGDPGTTVAGAANGAGGWRGRAQQIAILRSKNRELIKRVEELQSVQTNTEHGRLPPLVVPGGSAGSRKNRSAPLSSPSPQPSSGHQQSVSLDEKASASQQKVLRKLEQRKRAHESARAADLEVVRAESAQHAAAADAAQARTRTLTHALRDIKEKLAIVVAKANNDDALIRALRAEVAHLRSALTASQTAIEQQQSQSRAVVSFANATPGSGAAPATPQGSGGTNGSDPSRADAPPPSRKASISTSPNEANRIELEKLRELRHKQAETIQENASRIAQLEIALQHERRMRAQWHPPTTAGAAAAAAACATANSGGNPGSASPTPLHTLPPSERDAYEAESRQLRSKVSVLRDEVKVLQAALEASAQAKERELTTYCRALEEAKLARPAAMGGGDGYQLDHGGSVRMRSPQRPRGAGASAKSMAAPVAAM